MLDKLNLLALAEDFSVVEEPRRFTILVKDSDLVAFIDKNSGEITYFVSDVYNSVSDYAEIDIEVLTKLKKFCELLVS